MILKNTLVLVNLMKLVLGQVNYLFLLAYGTNNEIIAFINFRVLEIRRNLQLIMISKM